MDQATRTLKCFWKSAQRSCQFLLHKYRSVVSFLFFMFSAVSVPIQSSMSLERLERWNASGQIMILAVCPRRMTTSVFSIISDPELIIRYDHSRINAIIIDCMLFNWMLDEDIIFQCTATTFSTGC